MASEHKEINHRGAGWRPQCRAAAGTALPARDLLPHTPAPWAPTYTTTCFFAGTRDSGRWGVVCTSG